MAATYPPRMPHPSGNASRLRRSEPGKVPAALLALIVHAGFFTVIVFGVTWQVKHTEPVMAELWDKLPTVRNEPEPPEPEPPPPQPEPVVRKVVEPPPVEKPPQPSKADIQLKARQEKLEREKVEHERLEKQKQVELEKKRKEEEVQKKAARMAEEKARAEQDARDAAANSAYKAYADRIATLIRTRANIPDTVSGKPEVTVRLKLLVTGAIFDARIIKPSGDRVYDDAVERAINGIRQWPLPENAGLLGSQRELNLKIAHER